MLPYANSTLAITSLTSPLYILAAEFFSKHIHTSVYFPWFDNLKTEFHNVNQSERTLFEVASSVHTAGTRGGGDGSLASDGETHPPQIIPPPQSFPTWLPGNGKNSSRGKSEP